MIRRGTLVSTLALALAACGGGEPPPPQTEILAPPRPVGPGAAQSVEEPVKAEQRLPAVTYDPKGRRDPYEPLEFTSGPKWLTVSSTRLTGIVWSPRGTYALLEGSDGIGYILRPGDTLGDGRLVEIGKESAVFSVAPRSGSPPNRVTLRLKTD